MPTPERPLVALLRAPGGEPWDSEAVRVVPLETSRCLPREVDPEVLSEALEMAIPIVVTSPRAARWLADRSGTPRTRVHCSGARTARILAGAGWHPVVPSTGSGGEAVAERLLADREGLPWVPPLYIRGESTAGTFEQVLRGRDLPFRDLVVYELVLRTDPTPDEIALLASCDAVAVMAPSCLDFLEHVPESVLSWLRAGVPALAGPTTARALRAAGWSDVREAPEPSRDRLLPLLQHPPSPEGLP